MLVHSLASKYARFVVIVRHIYWTPRFRPLDPPLLKSDDLFFREPRDIGPPLSKILDTPLTTVGSHGCMIKITYITPTNTTSPQGPSRVLSI